MARVRTPGVSVLLIDIDPAKATVAATLELPFRSDAEGVGDFEVIVHASGNPEGLRTALAIAAFEARIIEMSWFGDREVSLPLGEAFHSRRLSIRSSQVGTVGDLAPGTLDAPAATRAGTTPARRRSARCADHRREPVRVAARGHA